MAKQRDRTKKARDKFGREMEQKEEGEEQVNAREKKRNKNSLSLFPRTD